MAGLVFGGILPHGAVMPQLEAFEGDSSHSLHEGCQEVGRRCQTANPDTILVVTPHGVQIEGAFCISACREADGTMDGKTATLQMRIRVDWELAMHISLQAHEKKIPVVRASYGAGSIPLDWGAFVPLWYCLPHQGNAPRVVIITPNPDLSYDSHIELGRIITASAAKLGRRLGFIASADWSHTHRADGPYGFHPASKECDSRIEQIIRKGDLFELQELPEELIENAKIDGIWPSLMLAGGMNAASDQGVILHGELITYSCPTYFGMLCAAYSQRGQVTNKAADSFPFKSE